MVHSESQNEYLAEKELVPGPRHFPKESERSVSVGDGKSQELSMERPDGHRSVSPIQKLGTGLSIIQQGFELGFPQKQIQRQQFGAGGLFG